jgi:large subunit ribosomal protein L6
MEKRVQIPENVDVSQEKSQLEVSADGNTVTKEFDYPTISVSVESDEVVISTKSEQKDDQAIITTYCSHINNMINGVQEGYEYRLKTVYAHFPMSVKKQGNQVVIDNFIGERTARRVDIIDGVNVEINEEELIVTGPDKENVSQTAARIEQACYKGDRDPRKFQDGIYITSKGE